jgi:hypothetical protein
MKPKRPSLKIHKPTVWILLVVVTVFVVITLYALNKSAERHDRKLMPAKHGMESKKEKS